MNRIREIIKNKAKLELDTTKDDAFLREFQALLAKKGYFSGSIDGISGPLTMGAWAKFKKDHYLDQPYTVGHSSLGILLGLPDRQADFFLPTKGIGWISSPFGPRSMGFHKGIDIAANTGTPVYAVSDGTVTTAIRGCSVGDFSCGGGYGSVIYLSHPLLGIETRYAHLSRVEVVRGDRVTCGQKIGEVGNTGHSFGAHLHFEIRVRGNAINPLHRINPIV
jgi:murein DD-endopeptidase MepM/ murein hydrolase activator NlpD